MLAKPRHLRHKRLKIIKRRNVLVCSLTIVNLWQELKNFSFTILSPLFFKEVISEKRERKQAYLAADYPISLIFKPSRLPSPAALWFKEL